MSKIKNEGNSYRHNDIKNMYLKSHKRVKNINLCSFENKEQNRDVIIKFMTLTFRTLYELSNYACRLLFPSNFATCAESPYLFENTLLSRRYICRRCFTLLIFSSSLTSLVLSPDLYTHCYCVSLLNLYHHIKETNFEIILNHI